MRMIAVQVSSDRGPNRYRIIGLAKEFDKTVRLNPRGYPAQIIIHIEEEDYTSVFSIVISPLTGAFVADVKSFTLEE